jgi:mRNA-degrading endonuclease RelE of RelBE toxin-antitoxin system
MDEYKIVFSKSAEKDLQKVSRVGVYRIIYTIEDNILTVEIVKIDNRSSVYK